MIVQLNEGDTASLRQRDGGWHVARQVNGGTEVWTGFDETVFLVPATRKIDEDWSVMQPLCRIVRGDVKAIGTAHGVVLEIAGTPVEFEGELEFGVTE